MGLTTADMIQISNRLKALENERDLIAQVGEYSAGKQWEKIDKGWKVIANGYHYEFKKAAKQTRRQSYWDRAVTDWDVTISKPGTRFKVKNLTNVSCSYHENVTAKICPENNKDLFSIIRTIHMFPERFR